METPSQELKRSCPSSEVSASSHGHSTRSKKARLDHHISPSPSQTTRCSTPPLPVLLSTVQTTSTPPANPPNTTSTDSFASTTRNKLPLPSPRDHWNIDLLELEAFFDYMYERHRLHLERVARASAPSSPLVTQSAPAYNTKSMTMADKARYFKSCNVFRELDAGTQDLLKRVVNLEELQPVAKDSSEERYKKFEDAVFRTILYRMFNKPLTYATLLSDLSKASPSPPVPKLSQPSEKSFARPFIRTPFPSPTLNPPTSTPSTSCAPSLPSPLSYSSFLSSRKSFNNSFRRMQQSKDSGTGEALSTGAYQIIANTVKRRKETVDWEAKLNILGEMMEGKFWDKKGKGKWVKERSLPRMIWDLVGVEGVKNEEEEEEMRFDLTGKVGKGEMIFKEIKKYDLFGDFLAFQLLLDLIYLPHLPLSLSLENDNWSSHGNGSNAGLRRMFKGKSFGNNEVLDAMRYLNDIQDREWERIKVREEEEGREIIYDSVPPTLPGTKRQLGLVEIEHALCEFSKLQKGTGEKHSPKGRQIDYVLPRKYEQGYVQV